MVMLNDRINFLGASLSFVVHFDLYRLVLALIPNNMIHSSNYNADLLQTILKETFKFYIYPFTKFVASDTINLETDVACFFYPRDVQVDYELHQLNSCLKYGFGICDNYRSKDMLDKNVMIIRNSIGKKVNCKVIVTPGGLFLEGEALVNNLKALAKYFDLPQREE